MFKIAEHSIVLILLASVLSGCGDPSIKVPLSYTPTAAVAAVQGSGAVALDVVNQDKRTQFRDRIGTVRGDYRRIVTDTDVSNLVRGAVEQVFKDQGFVVAPGGLVITVELQNFYCDYGLSKSVSIGFTLRVRDGAGRALYSHYFESGANDGNLLTFDSPAEIKGLFNRALGEAVDLVVNDHALQRSMLSIKSKSVSVSGPRT